MVRNTQRSRVPAPPLSRRFWLACCSPLRHWPNPATVPGIYTKLLDVDRVDLIIGGYGTNMLAPAMPVVIQKKKMLIGLFGLAVNSEFHYPNYFAMIPSGPAPKTAFTKGFFDTAMAQNPKPKTVAIVAADA